MKSDLCGCGVVKTFLTLSDHKRVCPDVSQFSSSAINSVLFIECIAISDYFMFAQLPVHFGCSDLFKSDDEKWEDQR